MRSVVTKFILVPVFILAFLLAACSQKPDDSSPAAAATVDTEAIADRVLSEVESRLSEAGLNDQNEAADGSDTSMATILEQVQSYLNDQEQPTPISLTDVASMVEASEVENTLINLYKQANPSVVYIIVPPFGSGSGFVYSDDGYIVTNNHVVDAGDEFEVVFSSGERRSGELIGKDVDSDLAVIKVSELPEGVEPLPLASSANIQVGEFVVAIGNPFGEQGSMSLGIVSGLNRSLSSQRETLTGNTYSLPKVIQTDAPINPGNSGGPLLNLDGEVVGVNSAIASTTGTNSGVGFSIPSDAVIRIVPSLIDKGSYDYPYMGVSFDGDISLSDISDFGLSQAQGAYVVSVSEGSPADQAGLIPADPNSGRGGDLVIDIDGVPIRDFSDLNSYLVFQTVAGQTINITVLRGDEEVTLPLVLGVRPE